jgi:protein tyrosine phosphatase (PTP) superfamily phosphohydrolase (DUF442 family)
LDSQEPTPEPIDSGDLPEQESSKAKRPGKRRKLRRVGLLVIIAAGIIAGYFYVQHSIYRNFAIVVPDQVYRSAQPSPDHLRQWTKKYGLKTVICLRGSTFDGYDEYAKTAKELGLNLITLRFGAGRPPPTPMLYQLIDALDQSEQPILLHCRSGIDRAGMASTLAQMAIGKETYADAMDQRAAWSKHASRQDGYIGTLFDDYEAAKTQAAKPTGSWIQFRDWAKGQYHPIFYRVSLEHVDSIQGRPGQTIELAVKLTNISKLPIPASRPDRRFGIAVFQGDSVFAYPDRQFGKRTNLPRKDLLPGKSLDLIYHLPVPEEPGDYELKIDLVDDDHSFFGRQGSAVTKLKLKVTEDPAPKSKAEP